MTQVSDQRSFDDEEIQDGETLEAVMAPFEAVAA